MQGTTAFQVGEAALVKEVCDLGGSALIGPLHVTITSQVPGNGNRMSITLRRKTSDIGIFQDIFIRDGYRGLREKVNIKFARNTSLRMIDAGANIGVASLLFTFWFPGSQIVAIEPDPDNFSMLCHNLSDSKTDSVKPIAAALWPRAESLFIDRSFRGGSECARRVGNSDGSQNNIRGQQLTALSFEAVMQEMKWESVDVLKMDIEGAEAEFFRDPVFCTEILPKVRIMAVEVHPENISEEEVEGVLLKNGFTITRSGEYMIAENRNVA